MIPFAAGGFFAGFLTCYWLVRLSEPAAPSSKVATTPPLVMLNPKTELGFTAWAMSAVSNETIQINGYKQSHYFDGGMPDLRSGYYDLFDPRYQPEIDVRKLK